MPGRWSRSSGSGWRTGRRRVSTSSACRHASGARADERLRSGAPLTEVLDYLGIPKSARPVVESVFSGPRSYVEVVAGCRRDGRHAAPKSG